MLVISFLNCSVPGTNAEANIDIDIDTVAEAEADAVGDAHQHPGLDPTAESQGTTTRSHRTAGASATIPTWALGDSWTYRRVSYTSKADGDYLNELSELTYTVETMETLPVGSSTHQVYRQGITGSIEGNGSADGYDYTLTGSVTGTAWVRMSDLAIVKMEREITGYAQFPMTREYRNTQSYTYTPAMETFDFPLEYSIEDAWIVNPLIHSTGELYIEGEGASPYNYYTNHYLSFTADYQETVTVTAGNFEAVHLIGTNLPDPDTGIIGDREIWYSPQVKNVVREFAHELDFGDGGVTHSLSIELLGYTLHEQPFALTVTATPAHVEFGMNATLSGTTVANAELAVAMEQADAAWSVTADTSGAFTLTVPGPAMDDDTFAAFDSGSHGVIVTATPPGSSPPSPNPAVQVVTLSVNAPPHASAEVSVAMGEAETGTPVTFISRGTDNDGRVVQHFWDFDGDDLEDWNELVPPGKIIMTAVFSYPDNGQYIARLRIVDDRGAEGFDYLLITVMNRPPIANAGPDTAIRSGDELVLDGSSSYDEDGSIADYHWDFGDSTTGEGETVTHRFQHNSTIPILYTVTLSVTDDDGGNASDELQVYVNPHALSLPVASASADPSQARTFETVNFTGIGTIVGSGGDPSIRIAEYAWDFDGDGSYDWINTTTGNTTHCYPHPGEYVATLKVKDTRGAFVTAIVSVRILNSPPIVAIAEELITAHVRTMENITFSARGRDLDGSVVRGDWDLDGDGVFDWTVLPEAGSAGNWTLFQPVRQMFQRGGNYSITVRIWDDSDEFNTTTTTVTILNRPPIITASASPSSPHTTDELTIAIKASDLDGSITQYGWDFDGDGMFEVTSERKSRASHRFTLPGTYTINVTARDDMAIENGTSLTIEVLNTVPTVRITIVPALISAGSVAFFGASASDPDGTIQSWSWDFNGDGTIDLSGAGLTETQWTYDEAKVFELKVEVTDDRGATASTTTLISVEPPLEKSNGPQQSFWSWHGPGMWVIIIACGICIPLVILLVIVSKKKRRANHHRKEQEDHEIVLRPNRSGVTGQHHQYNREMHPHQYHSYHDQPPPPAYPPSQEQGVGPGSDSRFRTDPSTGSSHLRQRDERERKV